ncbi:diacylglycerol kinase family protein, partial [Georgenia sp. 10Sc9-8]|nr:diacylglycerol kinase family protein [Georgenia halotolerans]
MTVRADRTGAARVGLVVNPTAGHGRGARAARTVHGALSDAGLEVVDLSGPTMAAATATARTGLAHGLAALVVVGGDGMVH